MQYLRKLFPDARFLLYVRNPIDHVASLIKQDRIWAELERDDPRQIEIIELTGHHEFGPHQVMANVGRPDVLREIRGLFDEGRWAQSRARYWAYMYGFVAEQLDEDPELARRVCIVRYEDLCTDSLATIDRIIAHTGLDPASFAQTRAAYGEKLSFPDYYKPAFDAEVMARSSQRPARSRRGSITTSPQSRNESASQPPHDEPRTRPCVLRGRGELRAECLRRRRERLAVAAAG